MRQRARNGGRSIFVQEGYVLSMGAKKVVKMQLLYGDADPLIGLLNGADHKVTVCWDWDVKLEATAEQR